MSQLILLCIVLGLAVVICNTLLKQRPSNPGRLPLPPGPKPLPLIGNLRDLSSGKPWLTYTDWGRKYGDIVYANILGSDLIILNSVKVATDLLEKRSHTYSDRPALPMRDLLGWDFVVGLMSYGDTWRKHRKCFQEKFKPDAALAYRPIQMRKVHELLRNLLSCPEHFEDHYKNMAAAIIMATMYGYETVPANDLFVENAERAITMMTNSMLPGVSIVNLFPVLRHLPSCLSFLPGAGFKQMSKQCRMLTTEMLDRPFDYVRENMNEGTAVPSVVSELLEVNDSKGRSKEGETMIKTVGATAYSAGADTVACVFGTFFYAAAIHTKEQRKAQEEIDSVVGAYRFPSFDDRPSLPYVEAFYREVMRWRPAMPLGVAHASTDDDIYNGYFIPKGAAVMSNVWAMTRNVKKYSEPDRFHPERFLTPEGRLTDDSTILTFGFGRRVCVGRHAADSTVWATIVSVLATFDIDRMKDEKTGKEMEIAGAYTDALISHVCPFRCAITPRSDDARNLIYDVNMTNI